MTNSALHSLNKDLGVSNDTILSEHSNELVIGLVGYVGAGCSSASLRLQLLFQAQSYEVNVIKLSKLIETQSQIVSLPVASGQKEGQDRFDRARKLQDAGDALRKLHKNFAVAALAIKEIRKLRGGDEVGQKKRVYILDSLKHAAEVGLLREVYGPSFRLVAIHCEPAIREKRLIGSKTSSAKYKGVNDSEVRKYMERDEKDVKNKSGQQVIDAFYQADFFLDNTADYYDGAQLNGDIDRFINLLLGNKLIRPNKHERAMYHAYSAALQSSCLSRQVGAALMAENGEIVSTGTNDVPKFGGGIYDEDDEVDNRCAFWEWKDENGNSFFGCHNSRKKKRLREEIAKWMSDEFVVELAKEAYPLRDESMDTAREARDAAAQNMRRLISSKAKKFDDLPGIKDIVEYSRSIHAEMSALFSAARNGTSTQNTSLYCTTYPCHNCARHMVTAGIKNVYYIEPYVKSLAMELHSDAISGEPLNASAKKARQLPDKMIVLPFTGVGPRMYEDFFAKKVELKSSSGDFTFPEANFPVQAVRLKELDAVERNAAALVPGAAND